MKKDDKKDHGAGLIHQAIPTIEGTLPLPESAISDGLHLPWPIHGDQSGDAMSESAKDQSPDPERRHLRQPWQPIATAPKGSGADGPHDTRHPDYIEPPRILAWSKSRGLMIVYWDWYYAEGGSGYEVGRTAWVNDEDGALWPGDAPTHWMPLPDPPQEPS